MPLHHRWLTSLLVRFNGKMLLMDCGEGTQIPLRQTGWGFKAIDVICFTHYHADHVAGLPGVLLSLANSQRAEALTLIGPPGLVRVLTGCMTLIPGLPYDLKIIECPIDRAASVTINQMVVRSQPAHHSVPCLSYALEVKRAGLFDVDKAINNKVPQRLWRLLQKGEIKELWLTHFSPALEHPEEYLPFTREIFENTHLGSSLKTKTLSFETSEGK